MQFKQLGTGGVKMVLWHSPSDGKHVVSGFHERFKPGEGTSAAAVS